MKKTAWKKIPEVNSILSPYFIFFLLTLSPTLRFWLLPPLVATLTAICRKAMWGGEGVSLTWWTRKFAVSFFWQNFYFPLVYCYLNRLFFVEILKIKKDLAGALQGVLHLLPYFSLVNCIALAYKIFYPIYAQYIKIFIEYLLRISKRNNNNNDYDQIEIIIIMIIRW